MSTPDEVQRVLEQKLAEAQERADEAARELARVQRTYETYMAEERPTQSMRRSILGQTQVARPQQPTTLYEQIANVVDGFGTSESFNARAVFNELGRDEDRYESTRPTITTTLRQLEGDGTLKKVGHGVYQRKK